MLAPTLCVCIHYYPVREEPSAQVPEVTTAVFLVCIERPCSGLHHIKNSSQYLERFFFKWIFKLFIAVIWTTWDGVRGEPKSRVPEVTTATNLVSTERRRPGLHHIKKSTPYLYYCLFYEFFLFFIFWSFIPGQGRHGSQWCVCLWLWEFNYACFLFS